MGCLVEIELLSDSDKLMRSGQEEGGAAQGTKKARLADPGFAIPTPALSLLEFFFSLAPSLAA